MKFLKISILLLLAWTPLSAQVITGFGSSQLNPVNVATDFPGTWTASVTTEAMYVSNVDDGDGAPFYSVLATPVTLTSGRLKLSGLLSGSLPAVDHFQFVLYDFSGNSKLADYAWSDFIGGNSVDVPLYEDVGPFSGTVSSIGINLFGGGDSVSFTFSGLSAVPEPSTGRLIVIFGLLYSLTYLLRRRACRIIIPRKI